MIKVLLGNSPSSLRDLLRDLLQRQPDIEVVGEASNLIEILLVFRETEPDVVVVTLPDSDEMPGICSHLFAEWPQLLILAISQDRERAFLYQQRISEEQLLTTSDQDFLEAIRRAKSEIYPT